MLASIVAGVVIAQVPEPPVAAPIVWVGPPECPDAETVAAAIEARLGRPLARDEVKVEGQIAVSTGKPRYRLALRLTAGERSEVRALSNWRCASLAEATAVLVTAMIGDEQKEELREVVAIEEVRARSEEAPSPPPVVRPEVERAVEVTPPVKQDKRRPGWFVRVAGGAGFAATPGPTGAIELATGALWRRARLEVRGIYLAPRTASEAMTELRVSLFSGAARGCARPGSVRVEVPLCGGLEVGGVRGDASGPGERDVTAPWVATVASAGVGWRAHPRVALSLAVEGALRVVGPRFELRGPGPARVVFEPGIVTARVLAGVELRFGDPR